MTLPSPCAASSSRHMSWFQARHSMVPCSWCLQPFWTLSIRLAFRPMRPFPTHANPCSHIQWLQCACMAARNIPYMCRVTGCVCPPAGDDRPGQPRSSDPDLLCGRRHQGGRSRGDMTSREWGAIVSAACARALTSQSTTCGWGARQEAGECRLVVQT